MVNRAVLATALAVPLAGVLLAARIAPVVTSASHFEGPMVLLILLSFLAVPASAILALVALALVVRGRRWALGPLLVTVAGLIFFALPLGPLMRQVDDALRQSAREELARRAEAGELVSWMATAPWPIFRPGGSSEAPLPVRLSPPPEPPADRPYLAPLPLDYPWAVSDGGGQRMLEVWRAADATRVTFFPHGGLRNGHWWIIYDSADRPPSLADLGSRGWHFDRVERLRDRWYRVVRD